MDTSQYIYPTVGALVLAAGQSSRMGQCKLLLPVGKEPLIASILRTVAWRDAAGNPLFDFTQAVLGAQSPEALRAVLQNSSVPMVVAQDSHLGMAHSLRCGLEAVCNQAKRLGKELTGVCVLLGDQPLMDTQTLQRLLQAFAQNLQAFVAPAYEGKRGNPVIIPQKYFAQVLQLQGDTGARVLLTQPQAQLCLVPVDSPEVLMDVDTPKAYEKLLTHLSH